MYKNHRISLVMPCWNEERGLPQVYRDLDLKIVDQVIAVDNNSTDRTADVAREFGATVNSQIGRAHV